MVMVAPPQRHHCVVALMSALKGAGKQSNECVNIRARSSVER